MGARGTSNGNVRGSSADRARRKAYLLKTYASDVAGCCRCYRCGTLLDKMTLTVDRIVPGAHGGKYVRTNIRPACAACNMETGGQVRAGKSEAGPEATWNAVLGALVANELEYWRLRGML